MVLTLIEHPKWGYYFSGFVKSVEPLIIEKNITLFLDNYWWHGSLLYHLDITLHSVSSLTFTFQNSFYFPVNWKQFFKISTGQFCFSLKISYVQISINVKRQYTVHGGNRLWKQLPRCILFLWSVYILP